MSSKRPSLPYRSSFVPLPADVAITAETHLDRRGRPYIYLSINYADQQFFLVPKRGTNLDLEGQYEVLRRSPNEKRRTPRKATARK